MDLWKFSILSPAFSVIFFFAASTSAGIDVPGCAYSIAHPMAMVATRSVAMYRKQSEARSRKILACGAEMNLAGVFDTTVPLCRNIVR